MLSLDLGPVGTLSIDLDSPGDRASLANALASFAGGSQGGPYTVVEVPGVNLTDSPTRTISISNERSLVELEKHGGRPVDRRRFRGNLWIDGIEPWAELEWPGMDVHVGEVTLHVTERIERCAATNANPDTGVRDMNIPQTLQRAYGHIDFGVLAEVRVGGTAAIGDSVRVPQTE